MPYGNSFRDQGGGFSINRSKESKSAAVAAQKRQNAAKKEAQVQKRTASQQKAEEQRANDKLLQEKKLIDRFLDEITKESGKVCYGVEQTMEALEAGAVKTLLVSANSTVTRWVLKNTEGAVEEVRHTLAPWDGNGKEWRFENKGEGGKEMIVVESTRWADWTAEHNWDYGARLKVVQGLSEEGKKFVDGYGGIGGLLRWNFQGSGEYFEDEEFEGEL